MKESLWSTYTATKRPAIIGLVQSIYSVSRGSYVIEEVMEMIVRALSPENYFDARCVIKARSHRAYYAA